MAKITMSAVVGAARGKAGGIVFGKNRGGAIVRLKVSPAQPRSNSQANVRSSFTALAQRWSATVTDPARKTWIALAANHPVKDSFGQTMILTGLQMYQRLNRALASIAQAYIDVPPASLAAETPNGATLVADSVAPTLTILPAAFNTAASGWVISATKPLSAGVSVAGAKFSDLKHGVTVLAAAQSFLTEYVAKFGTLTAGYKIFARIRYINKTTGASGQPAQDNQIVT